MNSVHVSDKTSGNECPAEDQVALHVQAPGSGCNPLKFFLSSLFIQSSFNYRGMQNLGFAFSMLPLARRLGDDSGRASFLTRHLQLFNTHPYLSGPIIGSVARMEEKNDDGTATVNLKNALMGPYAALGDSFFWGALKPFAAVFGVLLALQQLLLAPVAFLLLYNPAHLWIRIGGFVEGYRRGKDGIDFIRHLNLPLLTGRIRWLSLIGLGSLAVVASRAIPARSLWFSLLTKVVFLLLVFLCYWGMKKGISQVEMLYWMFVISLLLSI